MQKLLFDLCGLWGPTGNEDAVADYIDKAAAQYADGARRDRMGNLIVRKKGDGPRLMVCTPMDSQGFLVMSADDSGFLRFEPLGSPDMAWLLGARVAFGDGLRGVIAGAPAADGKPLKARDCHIDIGAHDRAEADKLASPGSVAALAGEPYVRAARVAGPGIAARVGCAVLLELMRVLPPSGFDIYFAFVTQDKPGHRGVKVAAHSIEPQLAITLNCAPALDLPYDKSGMRIGDGMGITALDSGAVVQRPLLEACLRIAGENNIPHQFAVSATGSGAGAVQLTRDGAPVCALSLPVRYIDTPGELMDLGDARAAVDFLRCALCGDVLTACM